MLLSFMKMEQWSLDIQQRRIYGVREKVGYRDATHAEMKLKIK